MTHDTVQLRAARIPGLPGLVADHYWFVVDKGASKDRWEVWQEQDVGGASWHHLHKNLMDYDSGVGCGESRVEHQWIGDEAERLIGQIERSPAEYPQQNHYRYWPGPNSNTYVQWVLDELNLDLCLGPTAIGKDFLGAIGTRSYGSLLQVSTPVIGVKLRWRDRFELQLLTLTFGIRTHPLRLILPFHRLVDNRLLIDRR